MDNYLEKCRNQLSKLKELSEPIELVIGNESCDLDSAVSAVGLAFIKYNEYNKQGSDSDRFVIPVLNITRNELELKTEVIFWFENSIHLNRNDLICRDQIDFETLKSKKVLITLVDHNINKQMSKLGEIIEIIDHHKYEPKECPVSDPSRVLIDISVGSCSTLIAERFLKTNLRNDTQMALMFFGTIILDTHNFSKSAQKYSERDETIVKQLESIIEENSISITRSEVYNQLIGAKNSTNNLTFEQLLLKDLKVVPNTRIIISSISGKLVSDLGLEDKRQRLQEFASNASNRFDAIIILGIDNTNTDSIRRDLAVFTRNGNLLQTISTKLESENSGLDLKLISESKDLRVYNQNNVKASRKLILPLISTINQSNGSDIENNSSPSNRKDLLKSLSTADVDPEFVLNYIPETIDFLESPQYSSMETEAQNERLFPSPSKDSTIGSPNNKTIDVIKESELEMPNIDVSKLNNPESIYGSYIEDSFVGELVGDYQNIDSDKDVNDLDNNWDLNNQMNNEIEFDFDSFGPESIIYTGNNDTLEESNGPRHSLSEETLNAESNANETNSTETSEQNNSQITEIKENGNKNLLDIPRESDSDLNPTTAEEKDEISPFKRNTSLTQSQRKKISPRINIQQILNSSDDLSPVILSDTNPLTHPLENNTINFETNEENNDKNANNLNAYENIESKGLVRRPSTTKKKIPVNREFFTSEELNDKNRTGEPSQSIEPMTARQELEETRAWRQSCPIGPEGDIKPIDMKVIDPYKKVISHGGYFHSSTSPENSHQLGSSPAIIVFSACYLPDRSRKDYNYVMDHLFMYVLTTLHNLIADDYILIYFHNAGVSAVGNNMPTFGWLKRCYYMIDRKLKKNLKGLYLVHPTFWLKTLIIMSKPFISSKFSRKLKFVSNLTELSALIPIEHIAIPEAVKLTDSHKQKKSRRITH